MSLRWLFPRPARATPGPRRRRLRVLLSVALALTGLGLAGWQLGAWVLERPIPWTGTLPRACGFRVDSAFRKDLGRLRAQVGSIMESRRVPGMAVVVGIHGRVVYKEGFGWANPERRISACPGTQFRAASLSKAFTAAALGRLVERGALDLDAPIQRYVPSFPDKGDTITAALLASHRGGIRDYRDDWEAINHTHYESVTASLSAFANDPLAAPPGTRFVYSGYGFVLLSAAIESAAGEDYLTHMRRAVFDPLGMTSTVPDDPRLALPDRAESYDTETPFSMDGSLVRSPDNDFSNKWAAGGFLSTAEDLVRFGSAFLPSRARSAEPFLAPATIALLTRPRSGFPPLMGYGMGWLSMRDLHLRRVYAQFGASSGGTAMIAVYPRSGVVVGVMANLGHAKYPMRQLLNIVRPFLPGPPVDTVVVTLLAPILLFVAWRVLPPRGP
ncbi:MAG TPA: serine hydrolase domain-containing protein [Gemmatimonadales bacterium]|nr:serine hydrolase domain-containing protein [Gemmatimonadales bacterium]